MQYAFRASFHTVHAHSHAQGLQSLLAKTHACNTVAGTNVHHIKGDLKCDKHIRL